MLQCTTMPDVRLDPLEYGTDRQWVLLKGEPKLQVPEGWKKMRRPTKEHDLQALKLLVSNRSTVRLMWRWDAPIDWSVGTFSRATKGAIPGSKEKGNAGFIVAKDIGSGYEGKHYLQKDTHGTEAGKLWVLVEKKA
jgi:hypothetical protein